MHESSGEHSPVMQFSDEQLLEAIQNSNTMSEASQALREQAFAELGRRAVVASAEAIESTAEVAAPDPEDPIISAEALRVEALGQMQIIVDQDALVIIKQLYLYPEKLWLSHDLFDAGFCQNKADTTKRSMLSRVGYELEQLGIITRTLARHLASYRTGQSGYVYALAEEIILEPTAIPESLKPRHYVRSARSRKPKKPVEEQEQEAPKIAITLDSAGNAELGGNAYTLSSEQQALLRILGSKPGIMFSRTDILDEDFGLGQGTYQERLDLLEQHYASLPADVKTIAKRYVESLKRITYKLDADYTVQVQQ